MNGFRVVVATAFFSACVPYPVDQLPADDRRHEYGAIGGVFPGLDPGGNEIQTLRFKVRAYGPDNARAAGDTAEKAYERIMIDTGLYSFRPRNLYELIVYGTQDEYRKKTGQPEWSGGVAVGNALYTYWSPRLEGVLSHEMTHLIWFEYMGRPNPDLRWVNEGLAVYQENKAAGAGSQGEMFSSLRGNLRAQPLPMESMTRLVPATERAYEVSLWYAQAESLVRFMIERGGRIGFAQLLASLRDGKTLDRAVADAFPGQWGTLLALENDWKRSLQ